MRNNTTEKDFDTIVLACVEVYGTETLDKNASIQCLNRLLTEESKVKAYIILDELKEAYLIAAKLNNADLMKLILSACKDSSNTRVQQLCEQFLGNYKNRRSSIVYHSTTDDFNVDLDIISKDINDFGLQVDRQ